MKTKSLHKSVPAVEAIKSLDEQSGWFEGYCSTWDTDQAGDRIQKNAFVRTLSHKGGQALPIFLNHNSDQICGFNYEASTDNTGLKVRGKLNLDTEYGKIAYHLLKSSLETNGNAGLSIGFRIPAGKSKRNDLGGSDIYEINLLEYSVTPFPCNQAAQPTDVKHTLPAISVESALKAMSGDESDLTEEEKEQMDAIKDLVEKAAFPQHKGEKKTKRVDGKDLTADQFAYVGDEGDTSTWKLPLHDAAHVRNALARFSQTDGIPESEKDAVLAKIKRAAEKFGIDVSESKGEFPMLLPNISVEQALAAVKGNEAGLSEEQKQSFAALRTVLAEMVKKDLGVAPVQKDDAETADGGSDPMSFEDAMSSRQAIENLENDRYNLENARHKSVHSILNSDCSKADKQQMLHKSLHSFADAMVAHHMKQLDTQDKYGKQANQSFPQVKGMNTEDHLKNQRKLGKAMSELDAHSAMNAVAANNTAMAADHAKRALNMMRDVARSYAANDVNLPNPEGTKAEKEQIERFKSSDVTLLVSALAVPAEP